MTEFMSLSRPRTHYIPALNLQAVANNALLDSLAASTVESYILPSDFCVIFHLFL
jgi:hypothetical protein